MMGRAGGFRMSGEAGFVMVKYNLSHVTCSREEREKETSPPFLGWSTVLLRTYLIGGKTVVDGPVASPMIPVVTGFVSTWREVRIY